MKIWKIIFTSFMSIKTQPNIPYNLSSNLNHTTHKTHKKLEFNLYKSFQPVKRNIYCKTKANRT